MVIWVSEGLGVEYKTEFELRPIITTTRTRTRTRRILPLLGRTDRGPTNIFGTKLWWLLTTQKWIFLIWIKIDQKLGLYF